MSISALYRRAITRLVLCLMVTNLGAMIIPFALYETFGTDGAFSVVVVCLLPWGWSLSNGWRHTIGDLVLLYNALAIEEFDRTPLALEQEV
jgi:hypothetical protein